MAKNGKGGDKKTGGGDKTGSIDDYNEGMELLDKALNELSGGDKGGAREDFVKACESFKAAVGKKVFFPEAYYGWGESLKQIAKIDDDETLSEEAIEKYMASGLQFVVDGRLMERPFIDAHNIGPKDKRHRMIFALYILTMQVIKGKVMDNNETDLLQDIRATLTSPPVILTLVDTLISEKKERQSIKEDDDLIAIATKILINVLIDNDVTKPEGPADDMSENSDNKKLN
ncbi:MAG: hypothetical protein JW984_16700 [Deltaproteobacteria bacterium]|uniref:Uncharacterized protein n=1 Tax=Candidatus Zymogenus saltonus TaxID=2844893 RepID=A0A9D8KI81_9DELT|nr:hypothetical protein [Candidatus Zymogenus saltonus]